MLADFRLNIEDRADQEHPDILALPNGNLAVVWDDATLDPGFGGFTGVRLSLFNADQQRLIQEYRVNDEAEDTQWTGLLAPNGNGFVVAFEGKGPDKNGVDDPYFDVYFQRFDANGTPLGPPDAFGGRNVQVTRQVSEDNRIQDIETLADGSFVIVVARSNVRTDWTLEAHRFAEDGTRIGTPTILHTDADTGLAQAGRTLTPNTQVTAQPDGGYLMTWWQDPDLPRHIDAVLARGFDANGNPTGPVQVLTPTYGPPGTGFIFDRYRAPETISLGDGRNLVFWVLDADDDGPRTDQAQMRIVDRNGAPLTPILDASSGDGAVFHPSDMLALGGGYTLLAYGDFRPNVGESFQDFYAVMLRLYGPDGRQIGNAVEVSEFFYIDATAPRLALSADGTLSVTWHGGDIVRKDVYATFPDVNAVLGQMLGVDGAYFGQEINDTLVGNDGGEVFFAGDGNDLLRGGAGADTLNGGAGADTVFGGDGRDRALLGDGNDLFIDNGQGGDWGRDTVFGGRGNDTIEGGNADDVFYGEDGDDIILGRLGDDALFGGQGADRIFAGDGADRIYAGEGDDTVYGGNGRDLAFLGTGADVFVDNPQGGPNGRDTVFAREGDDTIEGGNGDDVFYGEGGNDVIRGRLGNDLIFGGDGFDTLFGGEGNDTVFGGNGRDVIVLNQGNDLFNDNGQGGSNGSDTVFAGFGNDTIQGGNGDDVFLGEMGNDLIFARLGNDRVIGGTGNDTLGGGDGADTFVFGPGFGADRVFDYQKGTDRLELDDALWTGALNTAQIIDRFATDTGTDIRFDFGGGNVIVLAGVADLTGLSGDLIIV
ncbi:calcium-binding protein [Thalassococcus sp. S3]|uniref:calcium-binding protein n=1 Tax=Thalassococcus sp. S3 TaxID=2017482 RepID=UPI0010242F72|nr:calcium-binding protein [Thalassococcus sp. S3]QBF32623.1 hypothetical protein CFI11_15565 [Thalassococcus sp. S3]